MSDDDTTDPSHGEDDFFEDPLESEHLFDDAEFEAEGWSIPRDSESVSRVLRSLEGLIPDIVRRASQAAVDGEGAEALRARLSERKIPRDVVRFLLGQADATKREVLRILSREIRLFLQNMDLGGELAKILTSLSFEVRMEVRFIPNDQALKPSAKGRVRVKRQHHDQQSQADSDDASDNADTSGDSDIAGEAAQSKRRKWSLRRKDRQPAEPDGSSAADDD